MKRAAIFGVLLMAACSRDPCGTLVVKTYRGPCEGNVAPACYAGKLDWPHLGREDCSKEGKFCAVKIGGEYAGVPGCYESRGACDEATFVPACVGSGTKSANGYVFGTLSHCVGGHDLVNGESCTY